MVLMRLLTQATSFTLIRSFFIKDVERQQPQLKQLGYLLNRTYHTSGKAIGGEAHGAARTKGRFRSSYVGSLRDTEEVTDAAYLRELYHKNDPEAVVRLFEGQPSLHNNPAALSEYVKALVKVDRLDESELLRTLQRDETQ